MSRVPVFLAIVLATCLATSAQAWQDPFELATKNQPGGPDSAGSSGSPTSKRLPPRSRAEPEFVRKTAAEWKKLLSPEQFEVTRMKATEPAFSGKYAVGHFQGTFLCVCCKAPLFSSRHKFDSGTGWPSFYQPYSAKSVVYLPDYSMVEPRIEVECRRCGAHLGHVFDDGPLPTGKRFCINSLSLVLKPDPGQPADEEPQYRRRTGSRGRSRTTARSRPSATKPAATAKNPPAKSASDQPRGSSSNSGSTDASSSSPGAAKGSTP